MVSSYFVLVLATGFLSVGLANDKPWIRNHWTVSVQVQGQHYCSGSLYSNTIIITAAHCFYKRIGMTFYRVLQAKEFSVLGGTYFKRNSKIRKGVSAIIHHDLFRMSPNVTQYDIGLMKSDPFTLNAVVTTIRLANRDPAMGEFIYANGWPLLVKPSVTYVYPELRQWRYIRIELNEVCQRYMPQMSRDLHCASNFSVPLFGDPGGPLVYDLELVGVVSGGYASGFGPVFYTSVPFYYNWLTSTIRTLL